MFVVWVVVTILLLCIELLGRMIVPILVFSRTLRLLGNGKNVLEVVIVLRVCLLLVSSIVSCVELIWPIRFTLTLIVVCFPVSRTVPDPIVWYVC